MNPFFATLQREIEISGVGLHCGQQITARLLPSAEAGIVFERTDLPGTPRIAADWRLVDSTTHATLLRAGDATVSTTEHLLAALWCNGVTHCRVALDGPEVPILDGSAQVWCDAIASAGMRVLNSPRPVYKLKRPIWWSNGDIAVLGVPHHELRVSVATEFPRDYLGRQSFDVVVDAEIFNREIAPARTFCLEEWLQPLQNAGLIRGGSLDNALLLSESGPSSPWRFADEIPRHKALDLLGDIALLFPDGGRLQAHLIAMRAGHGPHRAWMEETVRNDALVRVSQ
jgi:UDP-3-O-[3-hydroxymyristoyl] N-acetylglucosamine deacetylase